MRNGSSPRLSSIVDPHQCRQRSYVAWKFCIFRGVTQLLLILAVGTIDGGGQARTLPARGNQRSLRYRCAEFLCVFRQSGRHDFGEADTSHARCVVLVTMNRLHGVAFSRFARDHEKSQITYRGQELVAHFNNHRLGYACSSSSRYDRYAYSIKSRISSSRPLHGSPSKGSPCASELRIPASVMALVVPFFFAALREALLS